MFIALRRKKPRAPEERDVSRNYKTHFGPDGAKT
jgi:hypothetical protein